MREGGSLFIIHYSETTLTSMFQMTDIALIRQKINTLVHADCQCNTDCGFLNELWLPGATNNENNNESIHEVTKKDAGGKWETSNLLGVA